jgi:AmmeMemoRadiSam system protein A
MSALPGPAGLGIEERAALVTYARGCMEAALSGRPAPAPPGHSGLGRGQGAFVTLRRKEDGALRGCVGLIRADSPLVDVVSHVAVAAALHDDRFPPVERAELASLSIEISVLGPTSRIRPEDVVVGETGLVIRARGHQGLLLPQVPLEHGWDRETFLDKTCVKAGLAPSAWRDPATEIQGFACQVFGE